MEKIHELNEQNFANEIQEKYDSKDLFKNKTKTNINVENENAIAKLENNKWYNKMFSFIKRIFKL